MRIVSLLVLAIFLPLFAHAAALVNINTADVVTLKTLPHIGDTLAGRIIDYRTQNGPFKSVTDLQKVSGIGSGSNYADIAPLITIGDTSAPSTPIVASSTESVAVSSGGASTYIPPPPSLTIDAGPDRNAILEVPLHLSAHVAAKGGAVDSSAHVSWSFGDGSSAEGTSIDKIYRYLGTYLIIVDATDGSASARDEILVTVHSAQTRISSISNDGITITNDASERLDLSGWRLLTDTGLFRIPNGTILLPEANVLFPFFVINIPITFDATLTYPDGVIAARYASPAQDVVVAPLADEQLSSPMIGSNKVQTVEPPAVNKVEPITSVANIQTHEITAVIAPTSTTELAAVGAALQSTSKKPSGLFSSPWTFSLIGVIALAGSAFIFL